MTEGVIADCIKAICDLYNEDYALYDNFKPAKWYEVEEWNFSDQCPLMSKKEMYSYFDNPRLFEKMEFMGNAKEVIERLSNKYNIIIVTKGTDKNFELKKQWLEKHLDCAIEFIGVPTYIMCKKNVDMSGGVFLDDRADNVEHSNAKVKIVFGDIYEWNRDWNGTRCFNWYDVERLLG